ncbi:MAG: pyrroline-5-carboxylate reductase [Desulfobulbaceae bacterium A2]|nr:MAG: pyrroline-5-carboxylate reductase [Desulfobulbaceae bacterium A2]
MEHIGFIGGGQMGEAMIRGLLAAGTLPAASIMVAEPDSARCSVLRKKYGVLTASSPKELASHGRVLIVAVKPQVMAAVLGQYRGHCTAEHLLISIAAGVPLRLFAEHLDEQARVIRVMPNTPALVLAGASALCGNAYVGREDMALAMQIFSAIGTCVEVGEHLMDAVTGLSGSGPGYVFTFIEAMIDAGVRVGLPRPLAESLTLQTIYGSVRLAQESGEHPALLKARVTSPGGTTIAGLHVLEEGGFRGMVMSAVQAATERSRELG